MSYESGLGGYNMHPTGRSPWMRGHMSNWRVGRPTGVSLQILHTASFMISDRPRSQAETDAEQNNSLMSSRARWVVGGHGLLLSMHRIHDRGPSRRLILPQA